MAEGPGGLVDIGDTKLFVEERGAGYPIVILHGGPGLDHHMFGDYLDALTDTYRLVLVDQRSQGRSERAPEDTWTLPQMAADVSALAAALELGRYAVLGHSYGAFVALEHAVGFPGAAAQTIVSAGLPSVRFLSEIDRELERFEPASLRRRVMESWERERTVRTQEEAAQLWSDQLPFHFADPVDPRIEEYERRTAGIVHAPDVIRHFAAQTYGGIDAEDILDRVTQPVLAIVSRHERTCPVEGSEIIAKGVPNGELVVLERSAHMSFAEETEAYVAAVRDFLDRHAA